MTKLVTTYFNQEGYTFPETYEHRFDPVSSAMMYSLIRDRKPKTVLEIGSWEGGSTGVIMAALLKNDQPFTFVCSELEDDLRKKTERNVLEHTGQAPIMIGDITKNLDQVPESLDFLFVDTNHDLDTTKWIVENIWPRVANGGMYCMHDWPVKEEDGIIKTKGVGVWAETEYLIKLIDEKIFPFTKVFWTYENPGLQETGFWIKPFWVKS